MIWSKRSTDFKELSPCIVWYYLKKSLKIPKGQSEAVSHRRTGITMTKRTNNNVQNTLQNTKDLARTYLKPRMMSSKQFLLHKWLPLYYSGYKPSIKSWIWKRTELCLQQIEHIHIHFWHRYSVAVNQVMVAITQLSNWWH